MSAGVVVSAVVVSFNGRDMLGRCLASLWAETEQAMLEVVVVDNASTDGSVEMVRDRFPRARLIVNDVNRGFAAANNQGILASTGEFILLLNPDTEIHDRAIERVLAFFERHSSAGIAGCRLEFYDGTLQCSVGAFPSLLEAFMNATFLYLLLPRTAVVRARGIAIMDYDREVEVDWVCGAFLMLRRGLIATLGGLDEQFYMYSEEVDFCRRARRAGVSVWYTPSGTVTHWWGGVSAVSERGLLWLVASQILYIRKHHRGIERALLIFLKYAGLVARIPVYAVCGLVTGNKSTLAKSRYAAAVLRRLLVSSPGEVWRIP
jgi:GT2 family glycosyltransferase